MKIYSKTEWLRTGLLLAFAGGVLNAYTYLWRGEVLATAVTGNIVLMGLSLTQANWIRAASLIFPIVSFALGVFAAEWGKHQLEHRGYCPQWRRCILLVEIAIILAVGFLPLGVADGVANVSIAFVSALQVESFRNIRGYPAFTTMCTGNLRSGMDGLSHWLLTGEQEGLLRTQVYALAIAGFVSGVLLCGWMSLVISQGVVFMAVIPLIAVYYLIRGECELPKK